MKISAAFKLYEEQYIEVKNQSLRTLEMSRLAARNLVKFTGDIDIENLTLNHIYLWKKNLAINKTENTCRGYILKLRVVISFLYKINHNCLNPDLIPVPKREPSLPIFLTREEVSHMIQSGHNNRTKFIISLLYASGIRLSELIKLNRGQIIDNKFTVIGKGKKPRLCFIDERTRYYMELYLSERADNSEALVVSYENKTRMTATNIQLLVRNAAKRAGIKKHVTPHTLRHSFATNFLRNNGNLRYLSTLLGHSSLDTTAMYTHVVDNDLEQQYQRYHSI